MKQPSLTLREIQEIEAEQQRAKEVYEAEQRRQLLVQQAANQPTPPAPGLPSTATWATSPSATPTTGSTSAWAKPLQKSNTLPSQGTKKSLSQIQREEEARKAKAAAALAASVSQAAAQIPAAQITGGKRYADLASKSQPILGGAWTTVGPGGKSKLAGGSANPLPTTPTAPAQTLRTMGSTIGLPPVVKKVAPIVPAAKPAVTTAEGEFRKWAMASLTGLKDGVKGTGTFIFPFGAGWLTLPADELLAEMMNFPMDASLIADTIYDCSTTMDGRRFAAEFLRRKGAAKVGVVIEAGSSNGGGSGGWNEVAKSKTSTQQTTKDPSPETNAAFKVVAGKKKGRR
jgi:PERQ amino acid-rich with GYF domain-containing protein